MMKVFRPFWSYDIKKTEAWLSTMAEKGFYLARINRWTRCFFFRQADPKSMTYRIGFDKSHNEALPKTLLNEGWEKAGQSGGWHILENTRPFEQIKASPARDGIIRHNRIFMYIFIGIFLYLTAIAVFNLSITAVLMLGNVTVEVVPSPMWIVTYLLMGAAIAVYILCLYSIIKIRKNNRNLSSENPIQLQTIHEESRNKQERLKHSGQLIVKRKFGWMYAPDKLEKWLESWEEQGLNLNRVNKLGTSFYFIKGNPRKVRYCADYQNIINESYFDILRETGWKSVFSSRAAFQKWTIWSREYAEGELPPELYSENSHKIKHARKTAAVYTIMFLPIVMIYLYMFIDMYLYNAANIGLVDMILFLICILMFGSFIVRIWLYYLRLKKR